MAVAEHSTGLRLLSAILLPVACLWGLGSYGLLDNNEGLYSSVAAGMLHGGSLIIPHLNGVPYLEKPPLLYWLTALSMSVFGENEFAARLPVALSTILLGVAMMRFLTRQMGSRTGSIAALIVASSPVVLIIGRTVYCDMLMTAFLSIGMMAFYRWYVEGKRGLLVFSYAMIGVAVMAKGIVALALAAGTAFLFFVLENNWKKFVRAFHPLAILAFLVIAAPWHVAASMQDKDFTWFYFINEHFLRFFGERQPHDYYHGPVWYYLLRLPLYVFPWSLLWLPLLAGRSQWNEPVPAGETLLRRFLWVWFVFTLVFFSLSRAKANYYMIAGVPPLVMLTALAIQSALRHRHAPLLWGTGVAALVVTGVLLAATPWISHIKPEDTQALRGVIAALTFWRDILPPICIAVLGLLICWFWQRTPEAALVLFCIPAGILVPLMLSAARIGEPVISEKQPMAFIKSRMPTSDIAVYHDFEELSSIAFYAGHPLTIVDTASNDLAYGVKKKTRPDLFPTLSDWLERPADNNVLIVRRFYVDDLKGNIGNITPPPVCLVKEYPMVAIFKRC